MKDEGGMARRTQRLSALTISERIRVTSSPRRRVTAFRPSSLILHPFFALLLIACVTSSSRTATGAWARQESGTLAWLRGVYFVDERHGWAVGGNGALLATHDGGQTWHVQQRPTEDSLRDVYFSDRNNGWLVCERSIYLLKTKDEPRSYLLKTTDGGTTWARVEATGDDVDVALARAVFADDKSGWAFGDAGALYATRDGGESWERQRVPTHHLLLGGVFLDQRQGWLVGAGATVLNTSDGGAQWRPQLLPTTASTRLNAVAFVDARHGWAAGAQGLMLTTTDGGRSWRAQDSGVSSDLLDVKFLDLNEGWAVGAEGTIIHTIDGGAHWLTVVSDTRHPLERLCFVNRARGWAVGFGGTIVAYIPAAVASPKLKSQ